MAKRSAMKAMKAKAEAVKKRLAMKAMKEAVKKRLAMKAMKAAALKPMKKTMKAMTRKGTYAKCAYCLFSIEPVVFNGFCVTCAHYSLCYVAPDTMTLGQ